MFLLLHRGVGEFIIPRQHYDWLNMFGNVFKQYFLYFDNVNNANGLNNKPHFDNRIVDILIVNYTLSTIDQPTYQTPVNFVNFCQL